MYNTNDFFYDRQDCCYYPTLRGRARFEAMEERMEAQALAEAEEAQREAVSAYEDAFVETPHCTLACSELGATAHSAACQVAAAAAPAIAAPVAIAIGDWMRSYAPALATPAYAAIGNGLYVRTRRSA